jgi:hypothetical protein
MNGNDNESQGKAHHKIISISLEFSILKEKKSESNRQTKAMATNINSSKTSHS